MRSKTKTSHVLHAFSRAPRRLRVFVSSSDWFIALFTYPVIGQSSCFDFMTVGNRATELVTAKRNSFHCVAHTVDSVFGKQVFFFKQKKKIPHTCCIRPSYC